MYTRLAIRNSVAGRPLSSRASRTTLTCSANCAVDCEPAPKKPSPYLTARRSAAGGPPPNQTGGQGFLKGVGSLAAPPRRPNPPPQATRRPLPTPPITPPPPLCRPPPRPASTPR